MSWWKCLGQVLCVSALVFTQAQAEEQPKIQPFVRQTLEQMSSHLASVQSFRLTAYSLYDVVDDDGLKTKMGAYQEVIIQRPNHAYARVQREDGSLRQLWYDGKTVTIMEQGKNTYFQEEVPDTIDAMLDYIAEHYNMSFPIADLLRNNIGHDLEQDLLSGAYLGERAVDGILCHHLSFESRSADFQLWVQSAEQPWPRRLVIDFVPLTGEPEYLSELRNWEVDPQIAPDQFTFVPPPGAERTQVEPNQSEQVE